MISKKNIIALAVAVFVLAGALLAVKFLWKDSSTPDAENPTESIEAFSVLKESILAMDVKLTGESFGFIKKDDGWVLKGDETVKLKASSVDYLAGDLSAVYAKSCVEENAADTAKYGLTAPTGEYTLTLEGGETKTLYLGKKDPVSGCYYFKTDDSNDVYAVYETKADSLLKPLTEYRDSNILEVDTENLSVFKMQKGATVLTLERTVTESDDGSKSESWHMKSPMNRECDSEPVSNNIISKISYVSVKAFIDANDERYGASGVANPEATVTLTDTDGNSQTIYIGKADGQNRYVKTQGRVYLIDGGSVSFIDVEPFIYISKFICIENINDVAKIEVTKGDKTYTATIEGKDDSQKYTLNGKEVLTDTFKRQVYQKVIGLLADEFAASPKYSEPVYTVTFYMNDGTVKKTDYCSYDDRSYAAFDGNGKCEFVIRHKKLEEMFSALKDVDEGRVTEE